MSDHEEELDSLFCVGIVVVYPVVHDGQPQILLSVIFLRDAASSRDVIKGEHSSIYQHVGKKTFWKYLWLFFFFPVHVLAWKLVLRSLLMKVTGGQRWGEGESTHHLKKKLVATSNYAALRDMDHAVARLRKWRQLLWSLDQTSARSTDDTRTLSERQSGRLSGSCRTTSSRTSMSRRETFCPIANLKSCNWTTDRTWSRRSWPGTTPTSSVCRK